MPDRGKVIYDIERCISHVPDACRDCSHFDHAQDDCIHCMEDLLGEAMELLKDQPEFVRCKDCKYCYYASNRIPSEQTHACEKHGTNVTQDWFCADGERK